MLESDVSLSSNATNNRISMLEVLKIPNFLLFWIGEGVSTLGDQFYMIAISILVLQLSTPETEAMALSITLMLAGIPRAIFIFLGGAYSDRFSPRMIMIVSNVCRAIVVSILTFLVLSDQILFWHLALASFVFGIADAFFYPSYNAMVPRILESHQLESGNALVSLTLQLGLFLGPAIGAIIISGIGVGLAFGLDVITFLVSILCLSLMVSMTKSSSTRGEASHENNVAQESVIQSIRSGIRYALSNQLIWVTLAIIAIIDFAMVSAMGVGLPLLAENRFGDANLLGALLASFGAGSILGILIGGLWRIKSLGTLFIFLIALLGIATILLSLIDTLILAMLAIAASGISSGVFNVVGISWMQRQIEPHMMGRVMSLIMFSSLGLQPIEKLLAGIIAG
ncbi:MFS transporter [Anaerolineales bacterium]